jgi:hypothetical protein
VVARRVTSFGGIFFSISNTPCGNTSRTSPGKILVKASAIGIFMSLTSGACSRALTTAASVPPKTHAKSTLPSFSASAAAVPP